MKKYFREEQKSDRVVAERRRGMSIDSVRWPEKFENSKSSAITSHESRVLYIKHFCTFFSHLWQTVLLQHRNSDFSWSSINFTTPIYIFIQPSTIWPFDLQICMLMPGNNVNDKFHVMRRNHHHRYITYIVILIGRPLPSNQIIAYCLHDRKYRVLRN